MLKSLSLQEVFSRPPYRTDYARAKAHHICLACGEAAIASRDRASLFEYTVSALCQQCQDQSFNATDKGGKSMRARCTFCGHEINLDHCIFDNYSGPVKCFSCSTMMEVKTVNREISSITPLSSCENKNTSVGLTEDGLG